MSKKRLIGGVAIPAVLAVLVLWGCSLRKEAAVGTPGNPLVVVFSPEHVPQGSGGELLLIARYLSGKTGLTVEAKTAATAIDAVDLLGNGVADMGFLTTEEYLVAREEHGVKAVLQVLRRGKETQYDGVILAQTAGGPRDSAELAGVKFAFGDPYSISGYFLPSVFLKKAGVKVEPVFAGSHDAAVKELVEGRAAAAATYAAPASSRPGLRVLAVTGTAPNEPVVARKSLLPEKREAVAAALLELPGTPEGRRALGAVADITGFRPVSEEAYRSTHELLRAAGKSVYDLLPGGWHIRVLSEPYMPL